MKRVKSEESPSDTEEAEYVENKVTIQEPNDRGQIKTWDNLNVRVSQ